MPNPTPGQRHTLNRDPVSDEHIVLLEFQEDGTRAVHRAAVNTEDVTFEGETFYRAGIDVILPQTGEEAQEAQLVAPNVDRQLGRALDSARLRVGCRMILVNFRNMDAGPIIDTGNLLVISSASIDADQISTTLGPRADLDDPYPPRRTTKQEFPGVWIAN